MRVIPFPDFIRFGLSGLAVLFVLSFSPTRAFSQGCPPAHLMSPSLGCQGSTYLDPRESLVTISYRHYRAFRDYQGGQPLPVPSPPDLYADTRVNLLDLTITRSLSDRFTLSFEMPITWASRETYGEHDFVSPHTMRSKGAGDARVIGNIWLLDPESHPNENVSVKLGLKVPSGENAAMDYSYRESGPVLRPVDPAIQPATGGWGLVFGAQGFKRILRDTYIYFDGSYLSNPREMNGTETPFADRPEITGNDIGYMIDSVPDLFIGRAGVSRSIWQGVSATFGMRIDGVRARDLLGGSDGYRLPGYSVSAEPGVTISLGKSFLDLTVPIAVKGHGTKSVADIRTDSPYAGIVTLADSQLILSFSRRF
jgi:hypothetical protein